MKEKVLNMINTIESFLQETETINKHPYSTGVDVEKVVADLRIYFSNFKKEIEAEEEQEKPVDNKKE